MSLAALRAVLRIARRDALRSRGRSALVVAMIALPVLGMVIGLTLYRSFELSPDERAERTFGAADAIVQRVSIGPVKQNPSELQEYQSGGESAPTPSSAAGLAAEERRVLALLPPGSRIAVVRDGALAVRSTAGLADLQVRELDYDNPLAAGMLRPLSGRAPRNASEVALSPAAAERTGLGLGGRIELKDPSRSLTVVALVENPGSLDSELIVGQPGALLSVDPTGKDAVQTYSEAWLVDTPAPVPWAQVVRLNKQGVVALSRSVLRDPPPREAVPFFAVSDSSTSGAPEAIAAGSLAAGLILLEVVLLAGPAFAVGAKRRRRELGVLAAGGATPAQLRRVVVGGGVVLGLGGAIVGVSLGVGLAAAFRPLFEQLVGSRIGGFRAPLPELAGAAAVAVLTGVVAALVPAWVASREDVVAALTGRRGVVRSRKRWVVVGALLAAVGVAGSLGAGALAAPVLFLASIAVGEVGVVLCTPAIVGGFSRLARWLPLAPRLALRDTARNRAASAPAVAAVVAAVAGSVALAVILGTQQAKATANYQPALPPGYALAPVESFGPNGTPAPEATVRDNADRTAAALRQGLPVRDAAVVSAPLCDEKCVQLTLLLPVADRCPEFSATTDEPGTLDDPRCAMSHTSSQSPVALETIVDDGAALDVLSTASADELSAAKAALRAGKAVVADGRYLDHGAVAVEVLAQGQRQSPTPPSQIERAVPAVVLDGLPPGKTLILPTTLARELGATARPTAVVAATRQMPTVDEEDATNLRLSRSGFRGQVYVERGFVPPVDYVQLIAVVAAGLVTLGGAAIATGLAAADGRADLRTLAAVGAAPRLRRRIAMSQAGVIALLGAGIGAIAGVVAGTTTTYALDAEAWRDPLGYLGGTVAVPWLALGLVTVVVPLLAMTGAGLFTRARLPSELRRAT